jgi:hypothetical protein
MALNGQEGAGSAGRETREEDEREREGGGGRVEDI